MWWNLLTAALVFDIVLPCTFAAVFPALTIRFMEILRFYRKGTLQYELSEHELENGKIYKRAGYIFTNRNGNTRNDTFRIMGLMLLIFLPVFIALSFMVYYFL